MDGQPLVFARVTPPRLRRTVELLAIDLHNHTLLSPQEIGADGRSAVGEHQPLLYLRLRDVYPTADGEERLLELGFGRRRADVVRPPGSA